MKPLFVCHANCARSVLACYLYTNLTGHPALSAGLQPGPVVNVRVREMLALWGIDASSHRPKQVTKDLCDRADAIFVMRPDYINHLFQEAGTDIAAKTFLFADPFSTPKSFSNEAYVVQDPSFSKRKTADLVKEFSWMRGQVLAILERRRALCPARDYMSLLESLSSPAKTPCTPPPGA